MRYRILIAALVAFGLALSIFLYTEHLRHLRAQQAAWLLVTEARMIMSVPGGGVGNVLFQHTPQRAIQLCTEALMLSPNLKDAYDVRASALDALGESESVTRDREHAALME
ncbi:MAG: hypothetical protein WCJ09_03525 [Planctomycetota bacterium]